MMLGFRCRTPLWHEGRRLSARVNFDNLSREFVGLLFSRGSGYNYPEVVRIGGLYEEGVRVLWIQRSYSIYSRIAVYT